MSVFDPHRLRETRLQGLKSRVPPAVKALPKAMQSRGIDLLGKTCRRWASPSDAILVTSSARSGSTWLFEQLASDPQVLPVFEPFHPRFNPRFRRYADPLGQFHPPTDPADLEMLARLVRDVYGGRALNNWSAAMLPRCRLLTARRTLVKEVFANRALWWLADVQSVPTLLLIRHPCAVVESMMRLPWGWHDWTHDAVTAALTRTLDGMGAAMPAGGVPVERPRLLAAVWAVETRAAMAALGGRAATWLVFYEDLVDDPVAAVRAIGSCLDLENLRVEPHRRSRTSRSRYSSSALNDERPLDKWRVGLGTSDIVGIIKTVQDFGVTVYTEDSRPNRCEVDDLMAIAGTNARGG